MRLRKLILTSVGLLLILTVAIGLTTINHPVILKWLTGTARHIGKKVTATVYLDGKVNSDVKIFHVDNTWNGKEADYYLVYLPFAELSRIQFFSVNRNDNCAGIPVSTSIKDYDLIAGHLFQSETGAKFTSFTDDIKGFNFDPRITFRANQIRLNIPASATELRCESIRIEF